MTKKFLYIDDTTGAPFEANSYEQTDFISTSAGLADANKPAKTNASGYLNDLIDVSTLNAALDHGALSGLSDDDHTQYSLVDGTRAYTGVVSYSSHPTFNNDLQLVDKKYVDDVMIGDEWYPDSALDYVVDNTLAPASENLDDVYVLSHDGGVPHANYDGASAGDIVRFNGTVWVATTPTTGTKISIDDETDGVRLWSGSSWDRKYYESTTASNGLQKIGVDIQVDPTLAGDGLSFTTGVLDVNVDDSSIEINTDILRVKALGITNAMLAGSISDDKLLQDYIQTSEVDDATIEWTGTQLRVKADGINDTHIDFGLGLNQVSAADIPIADSGSYTSETDVEGALQELYGLVDQRGVEYVVGTGGVTKGDLVYISGNNTVQTLASLTTASRAIGPCNSTQLVSETVKVLANDTVLSGVLSGATAGQVYYWDGSSFVSTMPSGGGAYVWQVGYAKNATDLHVETVLLKKNA